MKEQTEAAPRRSTYIDPDTVPVQVEAKQGVDEPSEDLQQTIAQARQAQTEELRARIGVLEAQLERVTHEPRGVATSAYEYTDDVTGESYVVVQVDTSPSTGRIVVYVNDGVVYDADPEAKDEPEIENEETAPSEEVRAASKFFQDMQAYLDVHKGGPVEILNQIQGRNSVQQALYIAHIESVAVAAQKNADNLSDLAMKSRKAQGLIS